MPKLVVFRGDEVESEVRLRGSVVRIGRDAKNEIVLDDSSKAVSRFHAEVRPRGGTYVIADLKSRNGIWIRGQRVAREAPLALGAPVTIGSFELVLEDDVSTDSYGDEAPAAGPATVAAASSGRPRSSSRSGTLPTPGGRPWSRSNPRTIAAVAVGLAILGVGAIAWVVVRNVTAPIETTTTTAPPAVVPSSTTTVPPVSVDPSRTRIDEAMVNARVQMQDGDFAGALATLNEVLPLDPENTEASELKRTAEDALRRRRPPPEPPAERIDLVEGIPSRPGESAAAYRTRASRIQTEISEGRSSLGKDEYSAAIRHFRSVQQDEPAYPGIDRMLEDAKASQRSKVGEAMSNGQAHETRGSLKDARGWYERAVELDPESTQAREKAIAVRNRLFDAARTLLEQGNYAMKTGDQEGANARLRQILEMLQPGDEIREQAAKRLEELNQ